MAGRRQHFIQQFFQKGFSTDPTRERSQIWVYRRDVEPFPASTENYGVERYFYGKPQESDLDDTISDSENEKFNGLVSELRNCSAGVVDSSLVAELVIYLWFRSKNYRSVLQSGMTLLAERVDVIMKDTVSRERFIVDALRANPTVVCALLVKLGLAPPSVSCDEISSKIEDLLPAVARLFTATFSGHIDQVFLKARGSVVTNIADQHKRELARDLPRLTTGARYRQLQGLQWEIVRLDSDLILGDSLAFVEIVDGRFKLCVEPGDELAAIWLPITSDRVLLGYPVEKRPSVSGQRINVGASSCSFDSFCAKDGPEKHRLLVNLIRTATFSLDEPTIEKILRKSLSDIANRSTYGGG